MFLLFISKGKERIGIHVKYQTYEINVTKSKVGGELYGVWKRTLIFPRLRSKQEMPNPIICYLHI